MKRRKFIKGLFLSPILASTLFGKSNKDELKVEMNGDLDDDLFIVKSSSTSEIMTHCFQMHNPKNIFNYNGLAVKSEPIYGIIEFNENIQINKKEVVSFFVANEREELFNLPELRKRTHFKAVDLKVNDQILIPSLIPENNDVPDYPTWYGRESSSAICPITMEDLNTENEDYNYYEMWENAVCGGGFVLPQKGFVKFFLFNKFDEKMFTIEEYITEKPIRLVSNELKYDDFEKHLLAEVDGGIHGAEDWIPNDNYVKRNSITKIVIQFEDELISVSLPYPLPYPNRLYAMYKGDSKWKKCMR